MGTKANVIIGSATVTFGGADLGFIIGGVEFHYEPEYHETFVDSYTGVLKRTLIRERAYAIVNMGESNTEKLIDVMPASFDGTDSLSIGDGTLAGAQTLVITPIDTDADPITIHKALAVSDTVLNHVIDGERIVQVRYEAEVDEGKIAGNRLFVIEPA